MWCITTACQPIGKVATALSASHSSCFSCMPDWTAQYGRDDVIESVVSATMYRTRAAALSK